MAHILLIDEDQTARKSLAATLRSSGHHVVEAASGIKGLVIFASRAFDLVIADAAPPREDGSDTITRIRDYTPDTPILAIAGAGPLQASPTPAEPKLDLLDLARGFGADALLGRPFTGKQFAEVVDFVLGDTASGVVFAHSA